MLLRLILLGALASSGMGASSAQTQTNYVAQSRLAYAAIRCEKYAEIASINEANGDSGRLFVVGYRALQSVLEARHSDESVGLETDATEPYGIILNIRLGPSPEFDVGRLHHAITDLAWAAIDEGVSGGVTADNFIEAKAVARRLYRDANCDLVGR